MVAAPVADMRKYLDRLEVELFRFLPMCQREMHKRQELKPA
jgi:hypothetical protein